MTHFLISCGGTGGHLAPGVALAQELQARGHAVTLLISEKQVDARLAARYPGLCFRRIPGAPFSLRPLGLVRFLAQQARGLGVAVRQVRSARPAAIVAFGGFTTAATTIAGVLCRVPIALHEANRVPGRAIRLMAPLARRVYLPAGVTMRSAWSGRIRPAGLPVRPEISRQPRSEACAAFGLDARHRVVVILGGSQGASALNDWARREAGTLAAAGVQLCVVTGSGGGETETLRLAGPDGGPLVAAFLPFCDRMAMLLSAADLVVSRAGAGTIAELVRCQAPAILVPYPFAADNHQAANAAYFESEGGGIVLEQPALAALAPMVLATVRDEARLGAFRERLRRLDEEDALTLIADDLEQIHQTNNPSTAHGGRSAAAATGGKPVGIQTSKPLRSGGGRRWRRAGRGGGARP